MKTVLLTYRKLYLPQNRHEISDFSTKKVCRDFFLLFKDFTRDLRIRA